MDAVAVKRALLTWDDVADAAEQLLPDQRSLANEIIAAERRDAERIVETSDGPWYLASAEVRGHAGVGRETVSLRLAAAKGLTMVSARNGTGKTSVADGLRHALSNGQQRQFEMVEDNIHCPDRSILVKITNGIRDVELVCDRGGIRWNETVVGSGPVPSTWVAAFERYLPVLLYPEISPVIERPGDLHDFLRGALSLAVLEGLLAKVDAIRKGGRSAEKSIVDAHQRAVEAAARSANATLTEGVKSAGSKPLGERCAELRQLAAELPSTIARRPSIVPTWTVEDGLAERISTSIEEFRSATARVVAGADKVQLALDHLLTAEGDYVSNLRATDTCPVCRTPGAEWVTTAKAEAARLRELLKAVHATKRKLGEAIKHLKRSMPPDLTEPTRTALRDLADNEGERRLAQWDEIARTYEQLSPDNATAATVERLVREAAELAAWYSGAAKVILSGHDSVVAEHATIRADICGWLDALDKARPDLDRAVAANSLSKTVEQWIKDTRDGIFRPIGTQVVQIWSDLNADADLKLTGLSLTGGVRQARKVDVTLSADGTPVSDGASNAAILSTGQRNALSLAAYLPRATQPASPFGFLVLDDPIHAFDVWRVRYLAKHLVSLAERYQIIVFTHDDRLWRELRALGCRPTHIRLDRPGGQKSHVRVKDVTRPSELMLDELQKVLDQETREPLGTEGARIAMTLAMCRQAVDTEATTQLEILGRRLGKTEADIHADRRRARGTRDQLDLLNDYATAANRPPLAYGGFTSTINALNDGAHGRVPRNATLGTCRDWVRQSRQLARRVYALAG